MAREKDATSRRCETTVIYGEEPKGNIAEKWRELHGEKNWVGLLSPLDLDLRRELLRYGDFIQVTEDAFPAEPKSRYPYACPYKKCDLLDTVGPLHTGYKVERYLYSYFRGKEVRVQVVNWIGYVAVTVDTEEIKRLGRRDIIIVWRGTRTQVEFDQNKLCNKIPIAPVNGSVIHEGVEVQEGFWLTFADVDENCRIFSKGSAGEQANQEVKRLLEKYAGEEMSITSIGHSLGGALATYCAYQIAEDGINQTASGTVPVTAITFGSPRVGTKGFNDRFMSLGIKHLRVKVNQDIAQCYPLGFDDRATLDVVRKDVTQITKSNHLDDVYTFFVSKLEEFMKGDLYTHGGTTLSLNYRKSRYLKQSEWSEEVGFGEVSANHHSIQVYMHLVNGVVGTDDDPEKTFKLVVTRDLRLINKNADALADPYAQDVPPKWWKMRNTGLVLNEGGFWVYPYLFDPLQEWDEDYD